MAYRLHTQLRTILIIGYISGLLLAACGMVTLQGEPVQIVAGGDVAQGRQAIQDYGCLACHAVPGMRSTGGVESQVGPTLDGFAQRNFLAGTVPNTPENLIIWLQDPPALQPMTAMPNVGVDEDTARHMAAYLYTLR